MRLASRFAGLVATGCAVSLALAACANGSDDDAGTTPAGTTATGGGTPAEVAQNRTVATNLEVPWGIAFLPGGDALVAERTTGWIKRVPRNGGSARRVMRVPGVDTGAGEGGLLGLAVSPDYRTDRLIYAYFTSRSDNRIVRFRLGGRPQTVLTGLQRAFNHNGGRIAFGPDGRLYAGVGDAGDPDLSQDEDSQNGKILRMEPDGSVPDDNPFPGSRVWSLGHRNVQGLAWDRAGRLWASEFGQNTWDEVNLIRPGRNYGWPIVEGRGSTDGGRFTNPLVTWRTSEASPSGAAVVGSTLYVAALGGERLWRVPLRGARVGRPSFTLDGMGRLRTVVAAPGGGLWVATSNRDGRGDPRDGDDRIVRIPAR